MKIRFGKTILWSALVVVGASAILDPREHPFWKDNLEYCDVCGGNPDFRCHCPGSARCPKLPAGPDDESHGDDI